MVPVLLSITNNSIKYQSPISNNSIKRKSFVCIQYKCQIVLFDPEIRPYQVLSLQFD